MRVSFTCIAFASLLALTISCSKKDSETVDPNQCLYIGKTVLQEIPAVHQKNSYGNEISWNEQKQMTAARRFDKTDGVSNITNTVLWTNDNQTNLTLAYDSDEFLTQKVRKFTSTFTGNNGNAATYEGRKYAKLVDETNETSDYKYESGRVTLVNIRIARRVQGNSETLLDTLINYTKAYIYDGQGNAVSATETNFLGKTVSTYKNGVIVSALTSTGDLWQFTEEYDDKGNKTALFGSNYRFNYTRDAKGNLTSAEYIVNNKPVYKQEYTYDDRLNPESTIPKKFKGIPDLIPTVQTSAGVNNLTGEKYNGRQASSSYEGKSTYLYNASGLPESSAGTRSGEETGLTETTTFRYKCP